MHSGHTLMPVVEHMKAGVLGLLQTISVMINIYLDYFVIIKGSFHL